MIDKYLELGKNEFFITVYLVIGIPMFTMILR